MRRTWRCLLVALAAVGCDDSPTGPRLDLQGYWEGELSDPPIQLPVEVLFYLVKDGEVSAGWTTNPFSALVEGFGIEIMPDEIRGTYAPPALSLETTLILYLPGRTPYNWPCTISATVVERPEEIRGQMTCESVSLDVGGFEAELGGSLALTLRRSPS